MLAGCVSGRLVEFSVDFLQSVEVTQFLDVDLRPFAAYGLAGGAGGLDVFEDAGCGSADKQQHQGGDKGSFQKFQHGQKAGLAKIGQQDGFRKYRAIVCPKVQIIVRLSNHCEKSAKIVIIVTSS